METVITLAIVALGIAVLIAMGWHVHTQKPATYSLHRMQDRSDPKFGKDRHRYGVFPEDTSGRVRDHLHPVTVDAA